MAAIIAAAAKAAFAELRFELSSILREVPEDAFYNPGFDYEDVEEAFDEAFDPPQIVLPKRRQRDRGLKIWTEEAKLFAENMDENHTSHLPQPSRLMPPSRSLTEMSGPAQNSRNGSMAPPALPSKKHYISNLPEPQIKHRRTLVERAGEPISANGNIPSTSSVRSTSFQHARSASSNSVYSASVGPGSRQVSVQSMARPKSSLAKAKNHRQEVVQPSTANGPGGTNRLTSQRMRPFSYSSLDLEKPVNYPVVPEKAYNLQTRTMPAPRRRVIVPDTLPRCVARHRDISFSSALAGLSIGDYRSSRECGREQSPSKLPRPVTPIEIPPNAPMLRPRSPQKSPSKLPMYLTRDSTIEIWDMHEKYGDLERWQQAFQNNFDQTAGVSEKLSETVALQKSTIHTLTQALGDMRQQNSSLQSNFDEIKKERDFDIHCMQQDHEEEIRKLLDTIEEKDKYIAEKHKANKHLEHELLNARVASQDALIEVKNSYEARLFAKDLTEKRALQELQDELIKKHNEELEHFRSNKHHSDDLIQNLKTQHCEEVGRLETALKNGQKKAQIELDNIQTISREALRNAKHEHKLHEKDLVTEYEERIRDLQSQIRSQMTDTERHAAQVRERDAEIEDLKHKVSATLSTVANTEGARLALLHKIEYLESDGKSQSEKYAQMERQVRDALEETAATQDQLRKEESLRRKIHNLYQELRGNIRVFCRVRPTLDGEADEMANMVYPESEDSNEIQVKGPEEKNSLGQPITKTYPFSFDRVFNPSSQHPEIFDEISQLVQSAIDGYNVCIFAYGQTGSGKTYTMSSEDGMIPRALRQIYVACHDLQDRGWKYQITGSLIEVYNEEINDLLDESSSKKKHEIRHDVQTSETTITDVTVVDLNSAEMVDSILTRAMANRSVAATKSNERSSRSHSVFILKLVGYNSVTGESSRGTLNLVDLAGSERVSKSGVEGARLKETQNINKSLSCLGDVIAALGQKKEGGHIPYRNSKLTHLLQMSLGGNSKTLMFVMVSPIMDNLGETLTSLKFATKVHKTHVGVAKKMR